MLAFFAALALQSQEAARAESLLSAGELVPARAAATALVTQFPRDARAHLLLGRVWFAWPVVGRYQALSEFRTAARLATEDPEPLYWQMEVGFHLGSDEGEVIAREAMLRILALAPHYRDVWARFQELYRNESIWRKADRALGLHPDDPIVLERRAEIAIALEEPARADSLAALVAATRGPTASNFLLRSDAAFLARNDSAGQAWHDSALVLAALDTAGAFWRRANLIASPEEARRYAGLDDAERRVFFEEFWGRRDPNLLTPMNERLGEHVRRLAAAKRQFRLLHPQRMWYRSAKTRALAWFNERRWLFEFAANVPEGTAGSPSSSARLDYQSFQDTAAGLAYTAGLDARGLTFVRHGKPDVRVACTPDPQLPVQDPSCTNIFDLDGWLYYTPEGPRSVAFKSAEYFAPTSGAQLRSIRSLLHSDRTVLPAPLATDAIAAFFRGTEDGHGDVYYRVRADTAALVFWEPLGGEVARFVGRDLLKVSVPAATYRFGLDVESAGVPGRMRGAVTVPWFDCDNLKLSSLILAGDSTAHDRLGTLRAMPADLTFDAGTPVRAYTEIYGLAADPASGRTRYRARYTFAPERSVIGRLFRGTHPVSFELERSADAAEVVTEALLLEPGRVPAGRYRVTVAVTDLATNVKSETVALVVTIR